MRSFPQDRSLSRLLADADDELPGHLASIAAKIRQFHLGARREPSVSTRCTGSAVRRLWLQNVRELREVSDGLIEPEVVASITSLGLRYIDGRSPLFQMRIDAGEAVEGHGDLLTSVIFLLEDGPRILERVEIDPTLRCLDTVHDVCSLALDIEASGRPDLGRYFLGCYAELCATPWPESLSDFYLAHRALVTAKVAFLEFARTGAGELCASARHLIELADHRIRSAQPRLVLVGGLPGTGKSTLAAGLSREKGWLCLSSDAVRKRMAGLGPSDDASSEFGMGIYDSAHDAATYCELLDEAAEYLGAGFSVILDASWIHHDWRDAARDVADLSGADLVQLRCVAGRSTAGDRGGSDAKPTIADEMAEAVEPWLDALAILSEDTIADSVRRAVAVLDVGSASLLGKRSPLAAATSPP